MGWLTWIFNLFRSDRAKRIRELLKLAVPIGEKISGMDWDGSGGVATAAEARARIAQILFLLGPRVVEIEAALELFLPGGGVDLDRIAAMLTPHLKKTLGILEIALATLDGWRALDSWGLWDTVMQLVYERLKKKA